MRCTVFAAYPCKAVLFRTVGRRGGVGGRVVVSDDAGLSRPHLYLMASGEAWEMQPLAGDAAATPADCSGGLDAVAVLETLDDFVEVDDSDCWDSESSSVSELSSPFVDDSESSSLFGSSLSESSGVFASDVAEPFDGGARGAKRARPLPAVSEEMQATRNLPDEWRSHEAPQVAAAVGPRPVRRRPRSRERSRHDYPELAAWLMAPNSHPDIGKRPVHITPPTEAYAVGQTVRGWPGRSSALSVFHSKSVLYGAFCMGAQGA